MKPEHKLIYIQGLAGSYHQVGDKQSHLTLVVLHGWNTTGGRGWLDLALSLSIKARIIVPDMPGFANSAEPEEVWGAPEYALWLENFIRALGVEDRHLVLAGHSFGGAVAAIYAARHPELDGLILIAPAIVRRPSGMKQKILAHMAKIGKSLPWNDIIPSKNNSPQNQSSMYKSIHKIFTRLTGSQDYAAASGIMRLIMQRVLREDLTASIAGISCPVLMVWGDRDRYTPLSQARQIQAVLSQSELKVYPGINHGLHLHAQSRLSEDLHEFISSLDT